LIKSAITAVAVSGAPMNIDENVPSLETLFATRRVLAGAVQTLAVVTRSPPNR
jgi:hypothetical protein